MKNEMIRESVKEYFFKNGEYLIPNYSSLSEENKTHIISIGTSIMENVWGENTYESGGFIKNFLNNNLLETFASADSININAIRFYLMLKYNLEKPF